MSEGPVVGRWALALVFVVGCAGSRAAPAGGDAVAPETVVERRVEMVAPAPGFADPQRRAKLEAAIPGIDAYLQRTVERDGLVGLAAGLVIDGELVWSRGYGLRDPARGLPVESDTAFGIGSITKSITASAVLLLRDRGSIAVDRPAVEYLPALEGLVYPTHDSPLVTTRHLLTHTSGLPRMGNFPEYPSSPQTRTDLLAALEGLRLDRAPGVERVYSNLGFQILGPLIREVAGEDHRTFIRRELLEPIGMTGSGWTAQEVGEDRLAMPHDLDEDGKPHRRAHWTPGAADAAGGLYASVEDLAAFAAFNLAAWPAGGSRNEGPLSAATLREAHSFGRLRGFQARSGPPGEPATARVSANGLGFAVYSTCRHPHVVGHGGKTMGHRASLHMLPRHGVAVILLSNLSSIHSSVLPRDGEAVLDLLADTGALQPRVPSAAAGLVEGAAAVGPLLEHWTTARYERAFSPDYRDAFTEPATAQRLGAWTALVGTCGDAVVVEATEAYAGTVELQCAATESRPRCGAEPTSGCDEPVRLRLELRVAPWDGHPITSMTILGATGLDPVAPVADAAGRAVALLNAWDDAAFAAVFAKSAHAIGTRDFLAGVQGAVGACELGEHRFVHPDGASYALACERGRATMHLSVDDDGRIAALELRDEATGPCR
jgi:CubicO group peptidase (beta-lactamase class C family)